MRSDDTQVEAAVRRLNPSAQLLRCERCAVDVSEVLGTGRFDLAAAAATAAWQQVRTALNFNSGRAACRVFWLNLQSEVLGTGRFDTAAAVATAAWEQVDFPWLKASLTTEKRVMYNNQSPHVLGSGLRHDGCNGCLAKQVSSR